MDHASRNHWNLASRSSNQNRFLAELKPSSDTAKLALEPEIAPAVAKVFEDEQPIAFRFIH